MKNLFIYGLLTFSIICKCNEASAGTFIWTGFTGTSWGTAANWLNFAVPSPTDDVQIGATLFSPPTVNGNFSCNSLTCTSTITLTLAGALSVGPNGLTINANAPLTVTGTGTNTMTVAGVSVVNQGGTLNNSAYVAFNNSVTMGQNATINNTGNLAFNSGSSLVLSGNASILSNTGTVTATTAVFTMGTGTGSINNSGSGDFAASGCTFNITTSGGGIGIVNSATFTATASSKFTLGAQSTISNTAGSFHISQGTVTLNTQSAGINNTGGTFTIDGGSAVTSSGTYAFISNTTPAIFQAGTSGSACILTFTGNGNNINTPINNTGTFTLGSTSVINLNGGVSSQGEIVKNTGTFTLQSDASGSASIGAITSTFSNFTGNYNVQRYMSGTLAARRGYRLLSSPVTQGTTLSIPSYTLTDLQATTPITGGNIKTAYTPVQPSNAFDGSPSGNPSVLYYYEPNTDPTSPIIGNSDYKGLTSITTPFLRGNGFLFFFRGNRAATDNSGVTSKFSTTSIPQSTTLNFFGALNQGAFNVSIPTTPTIAAINGTYSTPTAASTSFSYTANSTTNAGLHLVGNPYACAIDLDAITLNNPFSSITNSAVTGNFIYMLNNSGAFGYYIKGSATAGTSLSNNGVGRFVLSGQGFFVRVSATAAPISLAFSEACKVTGESPVPSSFFARLPSTVTAIAATTVQTSKLQLLRINLSLDSLHANETDLVFGTAKNSFDPHEDAYYMSSPSQTTFLASYTADTQPCLFNQMGSLDSIKTIGLYTNATASGTYTMKFTGASSVDPRYKLYLIDNLLKDSLDLSANDTYSFNLDLSNAQTYGSARFDIAVHANGTFNAYKLLSFTGVKTAAGALLAWATQYEDNYTGFILQRSTDNWQTYTVINTLQSNGSGTYNFLDTSPPKTADQYRLVQNIPGNASSFSNTVTLDYSTAVNPAKFVIYPNPVAVSMQLSLPAGINSTLDIKVYNMSGSQMLNSKISSGSTLSVDVSKLIKGTYVVKVTDSNDVYYGAETFTKL